jgi:hypothetical protein
MSLIVAYDNWCIDHLEALLRWLEEWLSISQKRTEQGMILLYIALTMAQTKTSIASAAVSAIGAGAIGMVMWYLHRRPAAVRGIQKGWWPNALVRVLIQMLFALFITSILVRPPHHWGDWANAAAQLDYLIYFYVTDINSGGQRGRKRKLAWAELKKLFGTEWMPKPASEPAG